ncbi:nucleic-acid-binding protein from transposon X-element [Trichonephila clavipes]|nr:nucleic-acid-binding protein from transposon X-element [Trichonephila clavipes]
MGRTYLVKTVADEVRSLMKKCPACCVMIGRDRSSQKFSKIFYGGRRIDSRREVGSAKSAKPVIAPSSPAATVRKTTALLRVAVEPLNKSTMPQQCYRCQEFFHHSRFCARAPKCLKCSGGHLTSECTKSAKAPAKCANCSGSHPANFSGCPKNPINTKLTKNVWQERAAARKQSQKQTKPSFAEIVKGKNNNTLDAKEVITKMAQMMSQWGEMLSLLQSKL